MGSAFLLVAIGAFLFFVVSAKRKAPKGKPGENDLVFSLRAAALGAVVGLVCFLMTQSARQSSPAPRRALEFYTRDLPNADDAVGVRGHFRDDGNIYVLPHMRSWPDGIPENNWGAAGNVNPVTGEVGTRRVP